MNLQSAKLNHIFDLRELKKLFRTYYDATGMSVTLYDPEGEEYLSVREDGCICDLVKEKGVCRNKIVSSGKKSVELKKPYIYETECGLIMCIAPIFIEENAVGYISSGPVCLWEKEDVFLDDFSLRCKAVGVDIEHGSFDLSKIKHIDCQTMTGLAGLLTFMVDYMGEKERTFRNYREEKESQYQSLAKEIETRSGVGKREIGEYPVELEKELITFVQLGEKTTAKKILNDLLAEIFLFAGGDLDVIKAKLYELTAFLSRTAVEVGAKITDLSDIVKKSSGLFLENIDFHDLCILTTEILDEYLDIVYKIRGGKPVHAQLVKVISYINSNYHDSGLTLAAVAGTVHVSPYYLSHLFHDELGTTFTDYLTDVRIEHAKSYLLEGFSGEQTAEKTGFTDASYFSKLFKKYVGVTPARYGKGNR
ncbi:MAG: PocR ligand-binding domain-containing protein [Clostridiales bacterium]|nr:PocR ligand-binding domain-containing protein [Clostridiales bacterium]